MNILVYIGYKAEGRISKRRLQENKARQIFRKTMISYYEILWFLFLQNTMISMIQTRDVCVSWGKKC